MRVKIADTKQLVGQLKQVCHTALRNCMYKENEFDKLISIGVTKESADKVLLKIDIDNQLDAFGWSMVQNSAFLKELKSTLRMYDRKAEIVPRNNYEWFTLVTKK